MPQRWCRPMRSTSISRRSSRARARSLPLDSLSLVSLPLASFSSLDSSLDELDAELTGPATELGINARYLLDALGTTGAEFVTLNCGGDLDPVVIRPDGEDEFLGVVMPMRI